MQSWTNFARVLPRDLFNEAKLLKNMGRLALLLHEGRLPDGCSLAFLYNESMLQDDQRFHVQQDQSDGSLRVVNVQLRHVVYQPLCVITVVPLKTPYSSREEYPLLYERVLGADEGLVFGADGVLSDEFVAYLQGLGS